MKKHIQLVAVAMGALWMAGSAFAATYTWTPTAEGTYNWDDATSNWTSGFPNALGDVANLNIDLAGAQTINLNQSTTVGTLNFGDTGSTYYGVTIAPNGGSMVMDVSTGSATIAKAATGNDATDEISSNITINDDLILNNAATAGSITLSGTVSGSGKTLTKTGAGLLNLNGATTLGNLYIGRNGAGGTVTMGSGATASVGTSASNNLYVGTNTGGSNPVGNGTFNARGLTAKVGILGVGFSSAPTSASGTSTGVLTLSGTGTIQADNVYVGVGLSSGAGGNFAANGTFSLASGATLTLSGTSNAGANLNVGWSYGGSNASAETGNMDLSSGAANLTLSQLWVGRASNSRTGTGTLTLSSAYANHLVVSGAGSVVTIGNSSGSTGTGTVTLSNLDATSAITSTNNSTAILLGANNANATGRLTLSGGTLTITTTGSAIAKGSGKGYLTLDDMTLVAGASSANWITGLTTAEIKSGGATIDTAGYDLGISQAFSGAGGLIKDGTGKLTLSGTQLYEGATEVQAGELSLTGSLHANSEVTVKSGATIGGAGTINGNLAFEAGSKLNLAGATIDQISTGILTVGGMISLTNFAVTDIVGWDWTAAGEGTYTLISGGSMVTLAGTTPTASNPYDLGNGKQGYFQEGSLQLVIIPEPATLGLIGVMGIALLLRRRMVRQWGARR